MNNTGFIVLKVHLEIIDCVKTSTTERDYGAPRLINRTIVLSSHHYWENMWNTEIVVAWLLFPDQLSVCLVCPFRMDEMLILFVCLSLPVFFFLITCLSVSNESTCRFVCPFVIACLLFRDHLSVCLVYLFARNQPVDLFVRLSLHVFCFLITCLSVKFVCLQRINL